MIIEEDIYLEHYGKKGMKWGVRKAREKKEFHERSGKQKAVIIGVGAIGALAGARFVASRTRSIPAAVIIGSATSAVGMEITERLLDRHGSRKVESES
jgi:hypothetical protein